MSASVSWANAVKVRGHMCWECGMPLGWIAWLIADRWQYCEPCGRAFLIVSDRLIIERIRLNPELEGKPVANVMLNGHDDLIRADGTAFRDELINGEVWIETPWSPPLDEPAIES